MALMCVEARRVRNLALSIPMASQSRSLLHPYFCFSPSVLNRKLLIYGAHGGT